MQSRDSMSGRSLQSLCGFSESLLDAVHLLGGSPSLQPPAVHSSAQTCTGMLPIVTVWPQNLALPLPAAGHKLLT